MAELIAFSILNITVSYFVRQNVMNCVKEINTLVNRNIKLAAYIYLHKKRHRIKGRKCKKREPVSSRSVQTQCDEEVEWIMTSP